MKLWRMLKQLLGRYRNRRVNQRWEETQYLPEYLNDLNGPRRYHDERR